MTAFCTLSHSAKMALILFVFLSVLCSIALFVYRLFHRRGVIHILEDSVIILIQLVLLSCLVKCCQDLLVNIRIPAAVIIAAVMLALIRSAVGIFKERKRDKKQLSPLSIKQAVDDLPMGLCFSDSFGRIILCNCIMSNIGIMLLGSHPQTLDELESALQKPSKKSGVEILKGSEKLYRFPDGRIRCFYKYILTAPEIKGYTQLSAQDVTDVYNENLNLERSNQKLRDLNKKLNKMYECLEDTVREKESLDLKIYIHDTLGRSLITIQDIISSSSDSVETKLENLKEAVSYLSSNRSVFRNTFEDVRQKAAEMGVRVILDGDIPTDTPAEALIVAAAKECVTNCIRHAKGDLVKVEVRKTDNIIRVVITNNGDSPRKKPAEGCGLSSLRRSVEASGGEMHIFYMPAFALILNIPEKEFFEL